MQTSPEAAAAGVISPGFPSPFVLEKFVSALHRDDIYRRHQERPQVVLELFKEFNHSQLGVDFGFFVLDVLDVLDKANVDRLGHGGQAAWDSLGFLASSWTADDAWCGL